MHISILICTRNRAASLRETLRSLSTLRIPEGETVELIVVDNGSTDDTATVVETEAPDVLAPRRVYAETPGLSNARNAGVAAAKGEILLFTDDDVRVPPDWIERMCAPFRREAVDAVAGGVRLALTLRRPWMAPVHMGALADTSPLRGTSQPRLVGANMALRRSVFERIPMFDPDLGAGPGPYGFHEETLFSLQVVEAGGQIADAYDTLVEHHPDPSRITPAAFVEWADRLGRSDAYVEYHWRHAPVSRLRSAGAYAFWSARLLRRSVRSGTFGRRGDGIAPERLAEVRFRAYHRQMFSLVGRPRLYSRFGLKKRSARPGLAAGSSIGKGKQLAGAPAK